MPQLPSGRHVGIDPKPLNDLLSEIEIGKSGLVWSLLEMDRPGKLGRYIEVVDFKRDNSGEAYTTLDGSRPMDSELKMVRTGLMVPEVLAGAGAGDLSDADRAAFEQFLCSERTRPFFEEHWERVSEFCDLLLEHGNCVQRVEVATWRWLQQE